jgi:hypothetical protein
MRSSGIIRWALISAAYASGGRLEFPNVFIPESKQAFVHLTQAVEEYRNIDFQIFILVFERLEPAMEKGVFYAVDQIWKNTIEPKRNPLFALGWEFKIESNDFSYFVNFTFSEIFIDETVSNAVNRLCIDANYLLADIPIAHLIPHHRSGYTLGENSFVFRLKYRPET